MLFGVVGGEYADGTPLNDDVAFTVGGSMLNNEGIGVETLLVKIFESGMGVEEGEVGIE